MTRLTNDIRERLTRDILRHRFADDADKLRADQAAFAIKVYDDLYDRHTQSRMADLPAGWLRQTARIGARFGYDGYSYTYVYFDGYLKSEVERVSTPRDRDRPTTTMLVQDRHSDGCAKVYDPSHQLSKEFDRLKQRESQLEADITMAKKSIETALSKVSSISRLVETWPEVAQFANKYDSGKPQLPALPTDHLNELLRLP